MTPLEAAIAAIRPLDDTAMSATRAHLDVLAKPPGSLGRLEELIVLLAGITGDPFAPVTPRRVVIAAGDHGVVAAQRTSAWPSSVTRQMVQTFAAGRAAVSSLARGVDADVLVLDVGTLGGTAVATQATAAEIRDARIRAGTGDIATEPAMTAAEAVAAIEVGLSVAEELAAGGTALVAVGEMGIGNTTAASAVVAALTGRSVADVTGRGAGLDDAGLARKVRVIEQALSRDSVDASNPLAILASVGGLEIATLVGVILGAGAARVPLVLDGFITGAAALVAAGLAPVVAARLIAGHRSPEPGHAVVLDRLGLRPLLDLELRLGEASGATLAIAIIDAAVRLRDEMATLEDIGAAPTPTAPGGSARRRDPRRDGSSGR